MFCSNFRRISMDFTASFSFLLFVLVIKVVLCRACVDDPTFSQAGNDCPSHVALASYNCYDTNVETSCCTSCTAVKRNVNGCEYGDRKPCFPFECASLIDISECCETCGTQATTTSTTTSTTSTASPLTTSLSTTSSTTSTSTPTSTTTTSTPSTSTTTVPSTNTIITTTTPSTSTTTVSASMNNTIAPATSSTTPSTIQSSTTAPSTSSTTTTPSTSATTIASSLTTSTTSTSTTTSTSSMPVTSEAISTTPSTTTTTRRTTLSTSDTPTVTSVSSTSPAITASTILSSSSPQSSPTTVSAMSTVLSSGTTEQSSVTYLTTGNMSTTSMSTSNLTSAAFNETTTVFPDVTEASSRVLSGLELGFVIGFSSIGLVLLLAAAGLAAYCWGRKRGGGSTLKYSSKSDYRLMDHTYAGREYKYPATGRHTDLSIMSLPQSNEVYVPYSGYSSFQNGHPGSLYYSSILPQSSLSSETPHNPYLYAVYDSGIQRNGSSKRPYSVSDRYLYRPHRSSSNLSTRNSDVNNGGWHRSTSALYSDLPRSRVS